MKNPKSKVAVIMGSDSDLGTMKGAVQLLERFEIEYVVDFLSAHRTPYKVAKFIKESENNGVKVIIAGAGGAAHLAGVIAAETVLPVIGVPLKSHISFSGGLDALLSIVQMPSGIPVATVGIDRADNAGILAAQIIATYDDKVALKLAEFKKEMGKKLESKSEKLQQIGYKKYLGE